ncbi:MAG: Flp pilus assembly protein TadD, partial [Polyangiales bacterium]
MRLSNLCLAALVLATSAAPLEAQQNPYDRELRRLSSEVRRAGRTPRGIVPLLELQTLGRDATPGLVQQELRRLAGERRISAPLRVFASTEQAYGMLADGHYAEAVAQLERLGFLTSFRMIGGFDDEGKQGFAREYPPEANRNAPIASDDVSFPGKVRPIHWRDYPSDLGRFGFVDFDATLRPYENACAYAETFVHVDRARPMSLWAGVGGAYKIWVNGEEVMSDDVYRMPSIERSAAVFPARAGHNRILVKVCVQDRRWGFYLRLGEADGSPPQSATVDARGATEASAAGAAAIRMPAAPAAPLAYLSARVEADDDDVAAHFDLARYLAWTGADDPADRKSRQLAERAAELRPSAEHLLYAAELAESRAERMRFVAQAEERAPRDAEVRLARIQLIATGPDSGRALRMLESMPMTTTTGLEATWLRVSLMEQHNLRQAAVALIRQAAGRTNDAIRWRYRLAAALGFVGEIEASWAVKREVLESVQDDSQLRMEFMDDAYERGASDELFAHLDQLRALDPADPRTLQYAASVYEGLGRHDEALAIYRQIIAYAPDEAAHHARLGRALLRIGQEGSAIETFRQVLALRPQDAATRQLMDRLQPRERVDEAWATSTE